MKKFLLTISMLIAFIAFSITIKNANYKATHIENNKIYEMDIIKKNDKIISISFDVKNIEGKSLIFGNKEKMNQKIEIERILKKGVNIENLKIFDSETTKIIKELYYSLLKE